MRRMAPVSIRVGPLSIISQQVSTFSTPTPQNPGILGSNVYWPLLYAFNNCKPFGRPRDSNSDFRMLTRRSLKRGLIHRNVQVHCLSLSETGASSAASAHGARLWDACRTWSKNDAFCESSATATCPYDLYPIRSCTSMIRGLADWHCSCHWQREGEKATTCRRNQWE